MIMLVRASEFALGLKICAMGYSVTPNRTSSVEAGTFGPRSAFTTLGAKGSTVLAAKFSVRVAKRILCPMPVVFQSPALQVFGYEPKLGRVTFPLR